MEKKIIAFSNLFPRDWEPNRATFNRQQLINISEYFQVEVLVPIAWTDICVDFKNRILSLSSKKWNNVKAHYFPYFFIPRFARWSYGFTMLLSSMLVLPKLIGSNRPDVIFATWAYPDAFAAICLGRLLNIPVVVKVHGSDINELPNIAGVSKQISWVLTHAKAIVSVSKDLAKKVIVLGADKNRVTVIYNGVDTSLFYPMEQQKCRNKLSLSKEKKIILFVGNLKTNKGCLDLLDAFKLLKQEQSDVELVYVGSGACEDSILFQSKLSNLEKSVYLIGQQTHDKLPNWMAAADLVVLPSYAEGVPNVLLEAMACGKPVVATNVGGIPEIVPDQCGILVVPHNTVQLYNAIKDGLNRSWDSDDIKTHASQYTWVKNSKALSAIFLDLGTRME